MATKQNIWRCPECQEGHRAPTRLRKIDARRYCLPCTEEIGLLVERFNVARKSEQSRKLSKKAEVKKRIKAATNQYPWVLHKRLKQWAKLDAWEGNLPDSISLEIKRRDLTISNWTVVLATNLIYIAAGRDQWKAYKSLLKALAWMAASIAIPDDIIERDRTYQAMYSHALADLQLDPDDVQGSLTEKFEVKVAPKRRDVPKKKKIKPRKKLTEEAKKKKKIAKKRKERKLNAEW